MTQTQMTEQALKTRRMNEYRREAISLWDLRSPYRQSLYVQARLRGKTAEQAIHVSRKVPTYPSKTQKRVHAAQDAVIRRFLGNERLEFGPKKRLPHPKEAK